MTIYDEIRKARDGASPGPWELKTHRATSEVAGSNGMTVCDNEAYYPTEVLPENQRLIALAPTMADALLAQQKKLEAAERLAHHAENLLNNPGDSHHHDGVALALAEYRAIE